MTSSLCNGLGILLIFVDGPIENVIVLETLADEEITEDLSEVGVVGLVVETKGTSIVKVDGELVREATAENFSWGGHLLLHDAVVLLLLGGSLQSLPWEGSAAEVEHNVSERLHIITTRLLDTQMSVNGSITSGTRQVLVLTVRNVEVSLGVTVLLGQTEIDDINLVTTLTNTHEEVIRLDIAVNEGLGVDVFDTRDQLVGKEKDGLQRELAVAEVEKILQTGSKEIKNHGIIVALGSEPADKWNSHTSGEGFVDTGLILELRVLGLDALELDSDFLARDDVGSKVNITETSTTNLSADTVFVAHAKIHSGHLELWTLGIGVSDTRVDEY